VETSGHKNMIRNNPRLSPKVADALFGGEKETEMVKPDFFPAKLWTE
jgi:hypothetical protein